MIVLDRPLEIEGLKNGILKEMNRIRYTIEIMKCIRVSCDICETDVHRASYSRHLINKNHLEKTIQNNEIVHRKKSNKTSCISRY